MKHFSINLFCIIGSVIILTSTAVNRNIKARADEQTINLVGQLYEFENKSEYEVDSASAISTTDKSSTLGAMSIVGDIKDVSTVGEGVPSFEISNDTYFSISYSYSNKLKSVDSKDWHLAEDSKRNVNGVELGDKIQYGAIILQTSLNCEKWVTCKSITNLSTDITFNEESGINNIQLINGCYYRLIVAYEVEKEKESAGFFEAKYEQKEKAEVYLFYASYKQDDVVLGKEYNYSGLKYTQKAKSEEFSDFDEIILGDPHYAMELGTFCLSGYTDTGDTDDIYLKTVGNKIRLTYQLKQDIFCLFGKDNLSIADINKGSDRTFQRPQHDMGHGELIIKYTNEKGESTYTEYSNYLEALTSPNADTTIQLFEEGDYEVALDYAIKDSKTLINNTTYYRTAFSFKIRNGNCMVYIFDAKTGAELSNGDVAKNGFRIDSAKSSYPKITIKKEILNSTANGLVEDPRSNRNAIDGEIITEEGIYTITAHNRYESKLEPAVKTIYVGDNNILTAYTTHLTSTPSYSIEQIINMKNEGYESTEDGKIIEPTIESTDFAESPVITAEETMPTTNVESTENQNNETNSNPQQKKDEKAFPILPTVGAVCGGILIGIIVAALNKKKHK